MVAVVDGRRLTVLVLLFRISEKVVTPTTVVLMTMVTVPGFVSHWFVVRDVAPIVVGYWLAAAPVAVAMAPIGAVLSSRMTRKAVVKALLLLIGLEVLTTIASLHLRHRSRRYLPQPSGDLSEPLADGRACEEHKRGSGDL